MGTTVNLTFSSFTSALFDFGRSCKPVSGCRHDDVCHGGRTCFERDEPASGLWWACGHAGTKSVCMVMPQMGLVFTNMACITVVLPVLFCSLNHSQRCWWHVFIFTSHSSLLIWLGNSVSPSLRTSRLLLQFLNWNFLLSREDRGRTLCPSGSHPFFPFKGMERNEFVNLYTASSSD